MWNKEGWVRRAHLLAQIDDYVAYMPSVQVCGGWVAGW